MLEGYARTRIGLGAMQRPADVPATGDNTLVRHAAAGIHPGYIRAHFGEFTFDRGPNNQLMPKEIEFDVIYGHGNDLKPGDVVDLVSTFNNPNPGIQPAQEYWHVYGMHNGPAHAAGNKEMVFTLPGTPPAPAAPAAAAAPAPTPAQ
jgi:hypothetical protein